VNFVGWPEQRFVCRNWGDFGGNPISTISIQLPRQHMPGNFDRIMAANALQTQHAQQPFVRPALHTIRDSVVHNATGGGLPINEPLISATSTKG
jgi:hypothetical protein